MRKPAAKAAAAAPVPTPGRVWLSSEETGPREFDAAHAARILAYQERARISGASAWYTVEVAAPAAEESTT